jgi:hypothetical protein
MDSGQGVFELDRTNSDDVLENRRYLLLTATQLSTMRLRET